MTTVAEVRKHCRSQGHIAWLEQDLQQAVQWQEGRHRTVIEEAERNPAAP